MRVCCELRTVIILRMDLGTNKKGKKNPDPIDKLNGPRSRDKYKKNKITQDSFQIVWILSSAYVNLNLEVSNSLIKSTLICTMI